ncbi:MAG: thiol reductant ABC exporter subunit CydD [Nocardioides sp.]|nr:thiol reductant ABC exporter subunit CydD [Nocardioides sp.]
MRPTDPRILRQLAPARRPLIGVVATGVLGAALVVAQAWVVTRLVLAGLGEADLASTAVPVVVVLTLRAVGGRVGDDLAARAAALVGTCLRRQVVDAALRAPDGASTGERSVLATRGVSAAEPYLTRYLPALVLAALLPPVTVVVIATQDLLSAAIVLLTLPLVPVFGALVGLATRDRAAQQWREMSSLSGHFLDVVRGLPTLVAHRRAHAQSARIGQITDRHRLASLSTLRLAFASSAVLELVATLSVALVAVTVGVRLAGGSLDLPTALFVLLLAPEAYWPLRRVGAEFHAAAEGVATFEAVNDLLSATNGVETAGRPGRSVPGAALVLDEVSVTYPGRTTPALAGLSATIPATGITVVTGRSGCGKSTLLGLVAGLVTPSTGGITAGAQPVGGPHWQAQVAWLPQRPHFVAGSIADNLRLAVPNATDPQLWSVLEQVVLAERVRSLPLGLATPLGEDGTTLSAGERARLALARIVLADRPWALLDEPTAHLDDLTERVIAGTIVELGRRGAVVMVAHGASAVALADRVIEVPSPATTRTDAPECAVAPLPRARRARRADQRPTPEPGVLTDRPGPPTFALSTALAVLASASGIALTATAGWLIVQASTRPAMLTLLVAIVGVRAFGLARPVLRYAERLTSHDAALRLLARRRVEVYDALVPLTPARLGRRRGDVLSAIADDVDSVVDRELRVRLPLRTQAVVAVLATGVAALVFWPAALVVAVSSALAGPGAFLLARRGARQAENTAIALRAELSTAVVECVQVASELVMWQAVGPAVDRVARTSDRIGAATCTSARWLGSARGLVLVVSGAAVAMTTVLAGGAVARGDLSGPMMALVVLLPLALGEVIGPAADAGALSARTDAAAERLHRLEHTAPAVRDTVALGGPLSRQPATQETDVTRVRARWDHEAPLTHEVSLRLEPGDRVAVTGRSGSGKSTLAALLVRFLDPASGRISVGGVSTRELSLDDVRRRTGLVDDDPHVFATTVVENVRLARPEASDAEVEVAVRDARLGPWLDSLPEGLHTWLGDGHAQVSGGERARLAIARCLVADQPVLVLDEPTAHLDHATATELAAELLTGARTRSVLWITHDTVGLDLADRVVDLGQA